MKTTQMLYLVLFIGIVIWVSTSTSLLDRVGEGFQGAPRKSSEPIIAKGVEPTKLPTEAMPNPSTPSSIPFAPYGQTASVGSFPFQDPAMSPAELSQIKKINEELRSFLVFEGANVSSSSDPTVQLPLTQLRADSQKLDQESSTLEKNPGIKSTLTQRDLGDIEGALAFLQRKVRLFESSGVVSDDVEGFTGSWNTRDTKPSYTTPMDTKPSYTRPMDTKPTYTKPMDTKLNDTKPKTRATKADLQDLQKKVYGAILILSSSGTRDPVIQSRIKHLQDMYTAVSDMIVKLNKGIMKSEDIPVYKEDIKDLLPFLTNPSIKLGDIFSKGSGKKLSPVEKQLADLVGEENAPGVFKNLMDKGMFKMSMDLGYNVVDSKSNHTNNSKESPIYSKKFTLQPDGTMGLDNNEKKLDSSPYNSSDGVPMQHDAPFDSRSPGMDDRAPNAKNNNPSGLDWKKRAQSICEQARLRGLDPLDFGCIPQGSLTSPAYSWRGHTKMICGRLGATMDPDLPVVCGCPPVNWKGWNLSY